MSGATNKIDEVSLRKVPEITVAFWAIKIAATTLVKPWEMRSR